MAKDYKNPEEFDPTGLTADIVGEILEEVKDEIDEKWHDIGNGATVKAKMTDDMAGKLAGLVDDAKAGNWKSKLEESIIQMILNHDSKDESLMWYGHLVTQCEIKRDLSMNSPAGVRFMFNKYELFINPLLFGLYSTEHQIAILKHEMLHIINLHVVRQRDRQNKKWNHSTDISINQLIKNIPPDGLQPETYKLEKGLNAELYYEQIPYEDEDCEECSGGDGEEGSVVEVGEGGGEGEQIIDNEQKLKSMIHSALKQISEGMVGDHSKWHDSEGNEDAAKEITRQMAETATNKSRGMSPSEAEDALALLRMKAQIDWKKELRRIVGNRKAFSRLTIKKQDRRFPHRRDLRGKTKDHIADILVIIDVSGSMSNEAILYGLNEIRSIAEKGAAGVRIIQVDAEPKLVEDFDPKQDFKRRGYGGTYLYPAVEMAMEQKLRFDCVVMITDGYMENVWDGTIPKVPFIWLISEDKSNLSLDIASYHRMRAHTLKIDTKTT